MKLWIQKLLLKLFGAKGQKTTMVTLEKCPKCGSYETYRRHADGTFYLPECFFQQCDECDHQWGHQ